MLAAEFHAMTGNDADTAFVIVEEERSRPMLDPKKPTKIDHEELRKHWGIGPEAQAGLSGALATAKAAKR